MSSYVRTRAIRYKLKPKELEACKEVTMYDNKIYEEVSTDTIAHKFNIEEWPGDKTPCFCAMYGINSKYEEDYFIDWVIDYEYDSYGDFELARPLTPNEKGKWLSKFKEQFPELNIDELRYVDYCYYNGVDAPAVWDIEEI